MDLPESSRVVSPPHPFVIEPPLTTETHFQEGESFDFHLLLFGESNNNLPYFIYAFEQMGKIGIGRRIEGKRGHFSLEQVKAGQQLIYSSTEQRLNLLDAFGPLTLQDPQNSSKGSYQVNISMITPLRLKFENRLKADLPFHVLVRAMLRRVSSLFNYYGDGEPHLDYRGLVRRAEDVRIVEHDLTWFDWRRYSFRQDKAMLMGGMVGSVTYEGDIGEYMPLIEFCSEVHLGKQTSFGLGKIEAEIVE
ncbi:MAG: CRISPR system precrRNA processing endoribonuclease RAMP protein Cas6 [Deltaproteobacteria bacterium]|nr:CRISPR system precrRNA processing endoribonuclease RAMP protein Cas6 [Deltaproteobacteria bacterium]